MKLTHTSFFGLATAVACPIVAALIFWSPLTVVHGVDSTAKPVATNTTADTGKLEAGAKSTNAPNPAAETTASTNTPPSQTNSAAVSTNAPPGSTNAATEAKSTNGLVVVTPDKGGTTTNEPSKDEVNLSFQGANVDMVAQWLAQTTGKSVVKHPRVQCQLTIMGGKKLTMREALNIVYRALAVEGNIVTETSKSIIITPEGSEPKISPELVTTNVPEGRQRLVKVFPLQHVQAADLRDKLKALLSEKAQIDIDDKANRIMITDYNDNIALASDLVAVLDTDNPADVTVRMIPLKHVNAQNLAREIQPLYQKLKDKNPKEIVEVSANDRSNSLIVLSNDPNFRAIEKLVASLDTSDAQEKVLQAYPLKNGDAQDVAKQLKDLYANQDDSTGPYRIFYFGGGGGNDGNSKKVNFVADRRRNAVIVQATPAVMPTIADMIKALDEPITDDSLAPKIFHLKYVSAGDIEDILNELFLKKKQQRPYWYYYDEMDSGGSADRDVGRLYGKVRITSEPYANVIIVTANSPENLAAVEEVLNQLDAPSQAGDTTLRVPLKFAKAADVATSINILFAKGGAPPLRPVNANPQQNYNQQQQQQQNQNNSSQGADFELERPAKDDGYFPWLGGQPDDPRNSENRTGSRPVSDLVGRVRVVPDQRANAILISANMHLFPEVVKLVEEMDAPTAQVLIEAKIIEVSSDLLDKLGVRYSPDGSKTFTGDDYDNSILAHGTAEYKQYFGPVVSALSDSQHTGLLDSTVSLDFLVQFLRKTTAASVLAEPQINIADNEMGRLFVGAQVPFIDNSLSTAVGGLNTSFSYKNVGVILEVTPHINANGDVALRIRAESSTIEPGQVLLGGAILDTRNFRTDMTAKNGQTVVLGGIIQKQVSETIRKVPLLGDIPVLGYLFKKKDKTSRQVELMVFLRPRVARTQEQAREILDDVEKKTPLIRDWQKKNLDGRALKGAESMQKEK